MDSYGSAIERGFIDAEDMRLLHVTRGLARLAIARDACGRLGTDLVDDFEDAPPHRKKRVS